MYILCGERSFCASGFWKDCYEYSSRSRNDGKDEVGEPENMTSLEKRQTEQSQLSVYVISVLAARDIFSCFTGKYRGQCQGIAPVSPPPTLMIISLLGTSLIT